MPAETLGKPLPTPHPDETSQPGEYPEPNSPPQEAPDPIEWGDPEESVYDSCLDDLNVMLAQPLAAPDPALESKSSAEDVPRAPRRTSELFATVGSFFGKVGQPTAKARGILSYVLALIVPGLKRPGEPNPARAGATPAVADARGGAVSTARDADHLGESRMTWFLLLLLSYSSAITLALFWVLWTGRTLRSVEAPSTESRQAAADPATSVSEPSPSVPLPPIPPENQMTLGQTIKVGDIEITPLAINSAPVELVGMIEPLEYRREDTDSLILRIKLTNVSKVHAITPLDRALIREQASPLDRSHVVTSSARPISLFPLAIDSEWLIQGQVFPELTPGESAETLLASEAITDDRLVGIMTWRVRLRTGPYRTDVVAVRFTKADVTP
jgi:hypothetical protein